MYLFFFLVSLNQWQLDLNTGTLSLTAQDTPRIDFTSLDCQQFTIVNDDITDPQHQLPLSGCDNQRRLTDVSLRFDLTQDDLRTLKLNQNLATGAVNSYLSIGRGNGIVDDVDSTELASISFVNALQVSSYQQDVTRPEVQSEGYLSFNLDSGEFNILFNEPVDVSTFSVNGNVGFQHFTDRDPSSTLDYYALQSASPECPNCVDGENITLRLSAEDLNNIKLNPRICTSGANCWLTIPEPGELVQDMAGNDLSPLPDGLRTNSRLVRTFIDDTTGPSLQSFILNMTSRELSLTFDEPVDASSFDVTGISILSRPGATDVPLSYNLQSGDLLTPNGITMTTLLSNADVVELQSRPNLATSQMNTYVVLSSSTGVDLSYQQNPVQAITINNALQADAYISDFAPPQLETFDLDLDANQLTLYFNEPVFLDSLDFSRLTLQSTINSSFTGTVSRPLIGGEILPEIFQGAAMVTFILAENDVAFLELNGFIATTENNTFLSAQAGFVMDTSNITSEAIPSTSAVRASHFIPDTSAINFLSFTLDMNTGRMNLTFDDAVSIFTFQASAISLQSAQSQVGPDLVSLTSSSSGSLISGFQIAVNISISDLNRIKQVRLTATTLEDTFITVMASVVDDAFGVDCIAITDGKAIPVSVYFPDVTNPNLDSFVLDVNQGLLILTFSETVDIFTFNISGVSLQLQEDSSISYQLHTPDNIFPSDADHTFSLSLNDEDINYIKRNINLGTNTSNTFLSITSSAIIDLNRNRVEAIGRNNALPAYAVVPDITSPVLESFDLDMDDGVMTLRFSETVNARSIDLNEISLVNRNRRFTSSYTLQQSNPSTDDSTVIEIDIKSDLDSIKSINDLATGMGDTFIVASVLAIVDMNGNRLVEIHEDTALQVDMYTSDITNPELVNFMLNLTTDVLRLSFSETVRSSSLDPTQITIQNTINNMDLSRVLTGGIASPADTTFIDISLTPDDLNNLKLYPNFATAISNTYISFTTNTIRDMAGNMVVAVPANNAERAAEFFEDTVSPMLTSFDLDLEDHLLVLTFDETVETSSFSILSVALQDRQFNPSQTVGLTSGSSTTSPDGTEVVIMLSTDDFNAITATFPLASMEENTFITLAASTVLDTNGIPSVEIRSSNALQITNHTADQTPPTLDDFDFDVNSGRLTLVFSESVNVSSFMPTQVTIQNLRSQATEIYTLTGGTITQPISTTIVVSLTRTDLNELKANLQLATLAGNTFLSITEMAISDMNKNRLVRIPMSDAKSVRTYTPDTTDPVIESFELDYDTGVLVLSFDETVVLSAADVSAMTFQNDQTSPSSMYTLSDSNVTNSGLVTDIRIQLSVTDFNELKMSRICVSEATCHLSVTPDFIEDTNMNSVQRIPLTLAMNVNDYIPDTTDPYVVHYTEFDLNAGTFTLELSETVNIARFNPGTLGFFVASDVDAFGLIPLRVSVVDPDVLLVYQFQFRTVDLNNIKLNENLCTGDSNCFIRFNVTLVRDIVGNFIEAVQADPLLPSHMLQEFIPDITEPVLQSFTFDLNQGYMTMTFDEVVNVGSFDPRELVFQNTITDPTVTFSPRMPGTVSRSSNGLELNWMMDFSDLILLKATEYLYNSEDTSYLAFNGFVADVSGNFIATTVNSSGLQTSAYVPDTVNPKLVSFSTLNFDNGSFSVLFDEPVNISCIKLEEFLFLGNYTIDTNPPKTYLNSSQYVLYSNGVISNGTNVLQEGEYILNCSSSFNFTSNSTLMNDTDILYPLALNACNITLNETIIQGVHLTGGEVQYVDERKLLILIYFNAPDLREVKLDKLNETTAHLSFTSELIKDFADNYVINISNTNATLVREFIPDVTVASFVFAVLDMDTGILSLYFDDVINSSTVNPNVITIGDGENITYALQGNYSTNPFRSDYGIHIPIEPMDLNAIKINTELATEQLNTYVLFDEDVAQDIDGRNVTGVATENFTMVENYTTDSSGPILQTFDLDLTNGLLNFIFDEAVIPRTYYAPGFVIQNEANQSNAFYFESYTLTGGVVTAEDNSTGNVTLTLKLSRLDMSALQSMVNLTISEFTSYARTLSGAVVDVNGNTAVTIDKDEAVPITDFTNDTANPTLLSFDLDLNDNFLILSFSEAVIPETLNTSGIILTNEPNITSTTINLTIASESQYFTSEFDSTVHIRLTRDDQEFLKENTQQIAKSEDDVFLIIENATVFDYVDLPLIGLADPMEVTNYFEGESINLLPFLAFIMLIRVSVLKKLHLF